MKVSIIIPAYNEEKRIASTLREILRYAAERKMNCEIVVVDDGSADQTSATVEREMRGASPHFRLIRKSPNRGKGAAVRTGMLEAAGDVLLFTDADLSTPIAEFDKLQEALRAGADVAVGSRAMTGSRVEVHQNLIRECMGKIFNRIARLLTFRGVNDSQCGFKAFTRLSAREIFSRTRIDGFSFDAEVIYLAQRLGFRVQEVPVVWRNSPASTVHIFLDPLKMFWDLFRIRFYHLRVRG